MSQYEYAAVPAPRQVPKVKGVKGAEARFAHGITELLNAWAHEGWEFVRAEAMGFEAKGGFLGKGSSGQTVLMIFRRPLSLAAVDPSLYAEVAPTPEELARDLDLLVPEPEQAAPTALGRAAARVTPPAPATPPASAVAPTTPAPVVAPSPPRPAIAPAAPEMDPEDTVVRPAIAPAPAGEAPPRPAALPPLSATRDTGAPLRPVPGPGERPRR